MTNVAINGFGRVGRLFLRQAFNNPEINIVAINDLGDVENLAYLLQYDSTYRRFDQEVSAGDGVLVVGGKTIKVFQERDPANLPWKELGIDVVIEATGAFTTYEKASVHTKVAGAKHVIISAPSKDEEGVEGGKTILMGVNQDQLATCSISSNGSCTTNATAPVTYIMDEAIGVEKAILTTVHGYTSSQALQDGPTKNKDFRRGRAAAVNMIPTTTGAAISVAKTVTQFENKFDGIAIRIPLIVGSLDDITFITKRNTTVEEVNEAFKKATKTDQWKDLVAVTGDQVVSSDIIGEPYGAIIDLNFTRVVDGNLVKVLAWYDNEWGYTTTLVQHVVEAAKFLKGEL